MRVLYDYLWNPVAWLFLIVVLVAVGLMVSGDVSTGIITLLTALIPGALLLDDEYRFQSKHTQQERPR